MPIECLNKGCKGRIPGARGTGLFWAGEHKTCPKCGTQYQVAITDDFSDDAVPYLISLDEQHADDCDLSRVLHGEPYRGRGSFAECTCDSAPNPLHPRGPAPRLPSESEVGR